jgi:hypothetical protein
VWLLIQDIGLFGFAAAVWLSVKLFLFPKNLQASAKIPAAYHMDLSFSAVPQKFASLAEDVSPRILTLWYVYPLPIVSGTVALLICAGLFLYWWHGNGGSRLRWDTARLVTVLTVVLLMLPMFPSWYRLLPSCTASFCFWSHDCPAGVLELRANCPQSYLPALLKRRAWNRGDCYAICSLGCFVAAMNNTQNALNSYLEFAFIKAQIAGAKIGNQSNPHRPATIWLNRL